MQPIALHLGPLTIHWYGVLLALGFLVGLWNANRRALRAGLNPEWVWDCGVWLVVGSVIGARSWHVWSYWDQNFAGRPWTEIFMVHHGGLVFYGGFLGAFVAMLTFCRVRQVPLWKLADLLAPSLSLGYGIGRNGCLMNGCCYGRPTDLPWAIRFPAGHETAGAPVHPTQIYDALLGLVLYLVLAWLYPRRRFDGQIFTASMIGYALARATVEFSRGDYPVHYLGGWLTEAHLVSLVLLAAGIALYAWQRLQQPASAPAGAPRR